MSQHTKAANRRSTQKTGPKGANDLGEEYLRAPDTPEPTDEEGGVVIEFKHELLDHFLDKADEFGKQHDEHTGEAVNRIENYERIQDDHKGLYDENHSNHHERRKLTEKIIKQSKEFEQYTKDSAGNKRELRGELDDLEDTLRKLKDQISEVEIENKNLQLIAETEQSIQDAKDRAEADAITAVNRDLKELVSRLSADSEADISYQEVSERIKADVERNYNQSQDDFNRFLQQSEAGRNELAEDLKELSERAEQRGIDNEELKGKIDQGELEIDRLNNGINALNSEIQNIRRNNDDSIKNLHRERQSNEDMISDLRKNADDLRLDHTKLEIGIMKINSQLQYLEEAAKSGGNDLIKSKIDKFGKHITQTEQDTEQLKTELNTMNRTWMDTVDRANREMSEQIRDTDSKATNDKINALLAELQSKQTEIDELKRKRSQLERELASTDPEGTQREVDAMTSELSEVNKEMIDLLREKNRLYGELIQYTRELYELNIILQKNEHEIARLRLELESLRKEQDEKRILYEELRLQIEERSQMLADLQDEITRNEMILTQLEDTLNIRREEGAELDQLLADRDAEIRELEAQLEEINRNRPAEVVETKQVVEEIKEIEATGPYQYDENDEVDRLLAQYINFNTCPVPVKRLGGGYYLFGTRKIYAKVMNGRLVIRVGGGYMIIDEFISTYAEVEVQKMEARRAKGLDPVPDLGGDNSPNNRSFGSPTGRSPKNRTMKGDSASKSPSSSKGKSFMSGTLGSSINGTSRTKNFGQSKIDKLRESGAARVIGSPK
jgi:chromosome segregation ATPase